MLHFINPREKKKNKSKVAEVATDCIKSKFSLKTTREFPKNMSFSLFLSEIAGLLFYRRTSRLPYFYRSQAFTVVFRTVLFIWQKCTAACEVALFILISCLLKPMFLANVPVLYPLKIPENQRFYGVFRGYEIGTLAIHGLSRPFLGK